MEKIARILRKVCFRLVTTKGGYFLGMLLVRLGRMLRKKHFKRHGAVSKIRQVSIFNHVKIEVDLASYMGGSMFWLGMHHVNEIIVLNSILRPHHTFVDVGANQGEFTLFAASKLTEGKVIAFEPVQKQLNMLKTNIALNQFDNIKLNAFGLSDKEGELPIYTSTDCDAHFGVHEGLSTLFPSETRNELEQLVTLKVFDDEYMKDLDRFDFLKIDIEGAELYALKGMEQSIKKFQPKILIEISDVTYESAGYTKKDLLDYLDQLGYRPFKLHRGRLKKINYSEMGDWGNYVFVAH